MPAPPDSTCADASPNAPVISGYRLIHIVGRGSYGDVWLAEEVLTGVRRAVKVLPKSANSRQRAPLRELAGIRLYQQKSRDHPALVQVLHVGETDDVFFYVMELADNVSSDTSYVPRTLGGLIDSDAPLPASRALELTREILVGLAHLHDQGLLHRDVKPSNVLFVNGRAKLADLGLVTTSDRDVSLVGTLGYLPPDAKIDQTADLYAVGIMLYEMITGLHRDRFPELPVLSPVIRKERQALRAAIQIFNKAANPIRKERYECARDMESDVKAVRGPRLPLLRKNSWLILGGTAGGMLMAIWAVLGRQSTIQQAIWHPDDNQIIDFILDSGERRVLRFDTPLTRPRLVDFKDGTGPWVAVGTRGEGPEACSLWLFDSSRSVSRDLLRPSRRIPMSDPRPPWDHQPFGQCSVNVLLEADLFTGTSSTGNELIVAITYDGCPTRWSVLSNDLKELYWFWHYGEMTAAEVLDVNNDGGLEIVAVGFANERSASSPYGRESEPGHACVLILNPRSTPGGRWGVNDWMNDFNRPPVAYGYLQDHVPPPGVLEGWSFAENGFSVFRAPSPSIELRFTNRMMIVLPPDLTPAGAQPGDMGSARPDWVRPEGGTWVRNWPPFEPEKEITSLPE